VSFDALSGLRAVVAWPSAPRPVRSTDLLPERALAGDPEAERQLIDIVARPLEDAGGALMETVDGYLEVGGVLESCARKLFVHPNTVRYRLRRVTELTGHNASVARDALVLQVGLAVGRAGTFRLHRPLLWRSPWPAARHPGAITSGISSATNRGRRCRKSTPEERTAPFN
jgi:DNA-binding PucR family transcriptional regulator